ncbi:Uncharacterised protein [Shigella sonnei]|nr:Uncharacterised protein [Shigella sonnei]
MSAEQEQDTAAKSGKKLSALLVMGGVIIIGGGYLLLTWLSPENAASLSSVNINSTTSGGGRNVMETQHYRDLLRADNERGAAEALRNNETFIASLPRGLDTDTGNDQKRDNPPDDQSGTSGQNASPLRKIRLPGKNGVRHYRNCLPVSIHSIRMPGHR